MDGTPFTQNAVPPGGSFLYKFTVTRPGVFWYHPHHFNSTNQVMRGLYGMIVVTDPNEAALQASGALPPTSQTKQLVLGDTTVCKAAPTNSTVNYPDPDPQTGPLPWVGGGALPVQLGPTPKTLCETTPIDDSGNTKPTPYNAGDVPAIQQNGGARTNEGHTVLTNGKNVGGRAGSPAAPGALVPGASELNVQPGQGLRLQLVNAAAVRYFRLRLTLANGTQVPLIRVGGEGGLLDNAVEEGGTQGTWVTGYDARRDLDPAGRACRRRRRDTRVRDRSRDTMDRGLPAHGSHQPGNWSDIPTVPVMHLNVTGSPQSPAYTISAGTPLRAATGDLVPALGAPTGTLLDPTTFSPPKLGNASPAITFTQSGTSIGVNGTSAPHDVPDYQTAAHLANSTRYAKIGDTLQLSVTNSTNAHHPFHLHGFSIQPVSLSNGAQTFTWPYHEFRDTVDIPPGFTLVFKIKIEDRPKADGVTPGGALGRWLFHCHIFFHAELGMLSELVVTSPTGKERPDINVNSGTVQVNQNQTATVKGTYFNVDGEHATLSSSVGSVHDDGSGNFTWTFPTGTAASQVVYLTATNAAGLKGQIPFFLQIKNLGPPTLTLPGTKTAQIGSTLNFGISASTPNAGLPLALGASGLPGIAALHRQSQQHRHRLRQGHRPQGHLHRDVHRVGRHEQRARQRDRPDRRHARPAPELTVRIGKKVRLSNGAINVDLRRPAQVDPHVLCDGPLRPQEGRRRQRPPA